MLLQGRRNIFVCRVDVADRDQSLRELLLVCGIPLRFINPNTDNRTIYSKAKLQTASIILSVVIRGAGPSPIESIGQGGGGNRGFVLTRPLCCGYDSLLEGRILEITYFSIAAQRHKALSSA